MAQCKALRGSAVKGLNISMYAIHISNVVINAHSGAPKCNMRKWRIKLPHVIMTDQIAGRRIAKHENYLKMREVKTGVKQ